MANRLYVTNLAGKTTATSVSSVGLNIYHPNVLAWIADGGNGDSVALSAASDFMSDLDNANITYGEETDAIVRLNLCIGNDLSSALKPMVRGKDVNGNTVGDDVGTNFVGGDYSQSSGLTGGGTRILSLPTDINLTTNVSDNGVGWWQPSFTPVNSLNYAHAGANYAQGINASGPTLTDQYSPMTFVTTSPIQGHLAWTYLFSSSGPHYIYYNDVQVATTNGAFGISPNGNWYAGFGQVYAAPIGTRYILRTQNMTTAKYTAFHNALVKFETAVGRN